MIAADLVAEVFVEVADTLVDDFDLVEFLQMLATRSSKLSEVSAAGLLLANEEGRLQLMAASDERLTMLELFQVQAHEGPCQDCFTHGVPVVDADLTKAGERWPRFTPRALEAGYRSVHAFPLRLRNEVIGALNLFATTVGRMDPADSRVIQALADVATIGLLQERAIRRRDVLAEQLQGALHSRITIEQAKGALAQIHGCSTDEAFTLLRAYARGNGLRLHEVAQQVTSEPGTLPELTQPPAAGP